MLSLPEPQPSLFSDSSEPRPVDPSLPRPNTVSMLRVLATGKLALCVEGIDCTVLPQGVVCQQCGKRLRKGGGRVVCRTCYQAIRRVMVTLHCTLCGVEYQRQRFEVEKAIRKGFKDTYCSATCARKHHATKNARRCACGQLTRTRMSRFCAVCLAIRRPSQRRLLPTPCEWCKTLFVPQSHRSAFCSKTCQNAAHSARMRGKGNSHFKTGTSYAKLFRDMREVVLERDGHCCVACGTPNRIITTKRLLPSGEFLARSFVCVHHLDEDPRNNRPENLVSLCLPCHKNHHRNKDNSGKTPFPWLPMYAWMSSLYMTSRLKETATSLLTAYSSTTVE